MSSPLPNILITIGLWFAIHELGHYISAKLFGFNPKFIFKRGKGIGVRYSIGEGEAKKSIIISFMGILGVIPALLLSSDFILISILVGYSLFEAINRWRSESHAAQNA